MKKLSVAWNKNAIVSRETIQKTAFCANRSVAFAIIQAEKTKTYKILFRLSAKSSVNCVKNVQRPRTATFLRRNFDK